VERPGRGLWRRTTISTWRELAAVAGASPASSRPWLGCPSPRWSSTSAGASCTFTPWYGWTERERGVPRLRPSWTRVCSSPPSVGAAPKVAVSYPATAGVEGKARWGGEVQVAVVGDGAVSGAVAAYVAKYATKSTDPLGGLDHRAKASDLDHLDLSPHLAQMVRTAWALGDRPELSHLRLRLSGRTRSVSGGTGSPRAGNTRPPSPPSARPGSAGAARPAAAPRSMSTRPPSRTGSSWAGAGPARATPG
jgi:hypothetical protein